MTEILSDFFKLVILAIVKMHYWGIGIGMALESACIPIPSEIILPFGGYLVSTGKLSFWGTVLAGTMGGTAGSALAYLVGRVGGRPFITRFGKYFFISPQDLKKAETWFAKYGEATAFFTRLLPLIRTFISLPCGIGKIEFYQISPLYLSWLFTMVRGPGLCGVQNGRALGAHSPLVP
ncbi:DedA family protein [Thermincola ferriacetica]